eukprot:CAMPEP_0114518092 /NCGR_PEP_ID=MMETSP0109-20121206/18254_1 /TAXON_ID=29199 /ORGANISM="Chlorarachnion reptans, Strain CCCM449" /LENGTH=249 /DNA_ID=CAMNT_0001698679 /DNA_START=414 /DNA_END=1163 /DNA_ORIENTATION=-
MDFNAFSGPKSSASVIVCPCCKGKVDEQETSYHVHLMHCLWSTMQKPQAQNAASRIQSMLNVITKLPLRVRISMMESFYRLSRTSNGHGNGILSPKLGAADRQVLNLLYNRRHVSKSKVKARAKAKALTKPVKTLKRVRPPMLNIKIPSYKRFFKSGLNLAESIYPFKPDLNAEISDSASSPEYSPTPSPIIGPSYDKRGKHKYVPMDTLAMARREIDEDMVRKIISQIEPSYTEIREAKVNGRGVYML